MSIYTVVVGNIGTVLETNQHSAAFQIFREYVDASIDNVGRAAGEDVTLFEDDEVLHEYILDGENN